MLRLPCLVAVVIVALVCTSLAKADPIGPLTLHPVIATYTPISVKRQRPLSLDHEPPAHVTDRFLVGSSASDYANRTDVTVQVPGYLREEANFIRTRITTPGLLDKLAALFDVDEIDRPWDTTTTVRFLAAEPVIRRLTPYATFSHQVDINEIAERMGIGGGLLYKLSQNMSLATEVSYFGSDREIGNAGFNREAIFMTHLDIDF